MTIANPKASSRKNRNSIILLMDLLHFRAMEKQTIVIKLRKTRKSLVARSFACITNTVVLMFVSENTVAFSE